MLTSLELENYRGFTKYRIDGLKQVNLLVGKNGSGKTSVLEALHLLLSPDRRSAFAQVAIRWRGETATLRERDGAPAKWPFFTPSAAHFFHGHRIVMDDFFRVGPEPEGQSGSLRVVAVPPENVAAPHVLQGLLGQTGTMPALALRFDDSSSAAGGQAPALFLSSTSGVLPWPSQGDEVVGPGADIGSAVCFFSATHPPDWVALMWDRVVALRRGGEVTKAMGILDPRVRDIARDSSAIYVNGIPSGFFVDIGDVPQLLPLGTLGDGFRHMLFLAIALVQRDGGVLLVDEIDTGLHYSIMGDMWRFVVGAAQRYDVQVFATTHSLDCVRGLAWLCRNHPELRSEVSLQKIVPTLEEAVAFDAEKIMIAAEGDIEVR